MTSDTTPLSVRDEIREYLQRRLENGNQYVKTRHVASTLGITSKKAAANMHVLAEHDDLERWKESNQVTYRITLGEEVDN